MEGIDEEFLERCVDWGEVLKNEFVDGALEYGEEHGLRYRAPIEAFSEDGERVTLTCHWFICRYPGTEVWVKIQKVKSFFLDKRAFGYPILLQGGGSYYLYALYGDSYVLFPKGVQPRDFLKPKPQDISILSFTL